MTRTHSNGVFASFVLSLILLLSLSLVNGQSSSSSSSTGPSGSSDFTLNLVFSTDVRGRMLPIDSTQADCTPTTVATKPTTCFGGVARRAEFIRQNKANYTNTVAIDVGNYYYGTSFSEITSPQAVHIAQWVTRSSYDIIGLGTNEFFNGVITLAGYLGSLGSEPAVVCSNIDVSAEPLLQGYNILKYDIQTFSDRSVAFIGAISNQLASTSSPGPNVFVTDTITALNATVNEIHRNRPDINIIVLVTTAPKTIITQIVNSVDGIDAVLYKSSEATDLAKQVVASTTTPSRSVVLLTIPYSGGTAGFGGSMGAVQLTFNMSGHITNGAGVGGPVVLTSAFGEDSTIWSEVQADYVKVDALNGVVVGKLNVDLGENAATASNPGIWCRQVDCNLGRFVTDAMLHWCQDCDIAHVNAGGLRANLYMSSSPRKPNVTRGDIAKILPFGNNFVSYSILGSDFVQTVLSFSLTKLSTGGFHQYSGVRWAYNPDAGATGSGGLVTFVSVYNRQTRQWVPIAPKTTYKVATLNFVLGPPGGDGYSIGPTLGVNLYGPPAVQAVGAWLGSSTFVPPPTFDQLQACRINTTYTLNDETGQGAVTWPYQACSMLRTDGTVNLADQCPTSFDFCMQGGEAYEGKEFNTSRCVTCSGLGTCISGIRACACDRPTTEGLFAGITMIQGSDCSFIRQEFRTSSGLDGFCYFLAGLSILVSIGCAIFFYVYRNAKAIKRAAFLFLQLACLGGFLGGVASVFIIIPTTDVSCQLSQWLGNMGWVLMFGSLFVKTWRIYVIFGNKRLKTVVLTDRDMLLRLGFVMLFEVLLRCLEAGISPPLKAANTLANSGTEQSLQDIISGTKNAPRDFYYFFTCDSSHHSAFEAANWAYKAAFTVGGCWLAYTIKDIQEDFNESKLLALVIYNMTIFAVIARVLIAFVGAQPNITLAVEILAINYVIICTLLGLAIPKYLLILRGSVATNASQIAKSTGGGGVGLGVMQSTVGVGGRSGHDEEYTQNVTMTPLGGASASVANGRVTPAALAKTFDTIRNRLRTSAADRTAELPLFLEAAQKFVDQLTALRGASNSTSNSSISGFAGRPAASNSVSSIGGPIPRASLGRALPPATSNSNSSPSSNSNSGPSPSPLSPSMRTSPRSPLQRQTIAEDEPVLDHRTTRSSSITDMNRGEEDPTAHRNGSPQPMTLANVQFQMPQQQPPPPLEDDIEEVESISQATPPMAQYPFGP